MQKYYANNYDSNEIFIPKWSESDFHLNLRKKIHDKIKTQPSTQFQRPKKLSNNGKLNNHKPKSKLTISTFHIALNPMTRNIVRQPFQIQRKIYHKVDENISFLKLNPSKMIRNLSAKVFREQPMKQNSEKQKPLKQHAQTFRIKPKLQERIKIQEKSINEVQKIQEAQQSLYQCKNVEKKAKTKQEHYLERIRKSKSQILKKSSVSPIKMQKFDTNPLLFYFKARNNIKTSTREMSIKKIRLRSTKGFLGIGSDIQF